MVGKRETPGSTRSPETLASVGLIKGDQKNKIYAKCRVRVPAQPKFHYVYVLIDTGNQAEQAIVSEELYRRIRPDCPLKQTKHTLVGAGTDNRLKVLGRAAEAISVEFYKPGSLDTFEYRFRPFVVRDLQLDLLLCWNDLKTMGANVSVRTDEIHISLNSTRELKVPLIRQPPRPSPVCTRATEVIPAGSEMIFPVLVTEGPVGRQVMIDPQPLEIDADQPSLVCCSLVDVIREGQMTHMRMWNISDHPVTIKKGTQVAIAHPLVKQKTGKQQPGQVAATTSTTQFQGREQRRLVREEYQKITTRKGLRDRLWNDLNFNNEEFGLTLEEKKEIVKELARHRNTLCLEFDECGRVIGVEIAINIGDAEPVRARCRNHQITEEGIFPDQDHVKAFTEWATPRTMGHVEQMHGLMSTFRKFVRNFAGKTKNIQALLKRKPGYTGRDPIEWTPECESEKEDIMKTLTAAPMVGHPDFSNHASLFVVIVDTSKHGIGGTLSQRQVINDQGEEATTREVVIFYGSRRLTTGESRYSAYKLELTGLVTAVESFRFYLVGREFLVQTDHKALQWLMKTSSEHTPAMCFRWQSLLAEYMFDIEYVPASKMKVVDALSRRSYREGDNGNLLPLLPKRDKLWDDDVVVQEARSTDDDSFWIPVMKKKFGTPAEDTETVSTVFMVSTRAQRNHRDNLQWKSLSRYAVSPAKGSRGAAGHDLCSAHQYVVPSHGQVTVMTDLAMRVPEGTYGRIASRSGLTRKQIEASAGVIDRDYTGNLGIVLFNHSPKDFEIKRGDRVAQLICEKIESPTLEEVDELEDTERGESGFGSTGMEPLDQGTGLVQSGGWGPQSTGKK
jgi:dUTP pyrophosphatase